MNFGKQIVLNICPFGATQNSGCLFCHFELSVCYEHLSHRDCIALANDLSFAILSLRDCIALANDLSFAILSRRDCTKYSTPTQKKIPCLSTEDFLEASFTRIKKLITYIWFNWCISSFVLFPFLINNQACVEVALYKIGF